MSNLQILSQFFEKYVSMLDLCDTSRLTSHSYFTHLVLPSAVGCSYSSWSKNVFLDWWSNFPISSKTAPSLRPIYLRPCSDVRRKNWTLTSTRVMILRKLDSSIQLPDCQDSLWVIHKWHNPNFQIFWPLISLSTCQPKNVKN